MTPAEACHRFAPNFVQRPERGDTWSVLTDGKGAGDCEDFSLTIFYMVFGGWLGMIWAILTGKAVVHRVLTHGTGENHAVGQIGKYWFDNWSLEALDRDAFFSRTGHSYRFRRNRFYVLFKLGGKVSLALLGIGVCAAVFGAVRLLS